MYAELQFNIVFLILKHRGIGKIVPTAHLNNKINNNKTTTSTSTSTAMLMCLVHYNSTHLFICLFLASVAEDDDSDGCDEEVQHSKVGVVYS